MAERYTRHMNDRREGRQLYTLPAYARIQPYILRRRSDAACFLSDSVEVTGVEKWLREKRAGGWANLGFLHLIIAAYVRTVSMRPGINRFVSGRRIYARNDIEVVLPVKRSASVTATETSIKVRFAPTDTVFDVYRKLTEATDEVRADISLSAPEKLANTLMRFPRVLLRMAMSIFRLMDYFDWLPRTWLDVSPFHGSFLHSCGPLSVGFRGNFLCFLRRFRLFSGCILFRLLYGKNCFQCHFLKHLPSKPNFLTS